MHKYLIITMLLFILQACKTDTIEVRQTFAMPSVEQPQDATKMCIWVYGEVKKPGKYEVPFGCSASRAIALAGSLTEDGKSSVKVRRYYANEGNYYAQDNWIDLVTYGGDEEFILQNNDEIHVGRWGRSWFQLLLGWLSFMTSLVL